jgi:hypothetical protein
MNFFITVELSGEGVKRRTDISEAVDQPIFTNNKFIVPFDESKIPEEPSIIFRAFVVKSGAQVLNED